MCSGFQDVKDVRAYSGQTILDNVRENQAIALTSERDGRFWDRRDTSDAQEDVRNGGQSKTTLVIRKVSKRLTSICPAEIHTQGGHSSDQKIIILLSRT